MKKYTLIILFFIITIQLLCSGMDSFPSKEMIKDMWFEELDPISSMSYEDYKKQDFEDVKKYSGMWSTINPKNNLDDLKIDIKTSSVLGKNYQASNLFDGKISTAWVEGAKNDGIGEWVKINLDAKKESPSSTPFSVSRIGIIPGYAKNDTTWVENNRVKTILLIIHSPQPTSPKENEWVSYSLKLNDDNDIQFFKFPYYYITTNQRPMTKTIWLRIEEIYKGTKYNDTCISELIFVGGCLP